MQAVNSSISNSSSKTRTIIIHDRAREAQRLKEKRKEKSNLVERRQFTIEAEVGVGFCYIYFVVEGFLSSCAKQREKRDDADESAAI